MKVVVTAKVEAVVPNPSSQLMFTVRKISILF